MREVEGINDLKQVLSEQQSASQKRMSQFLEEAEQRRKELGMDHKARVYSSSQSKNLFPNFTTMRNQSESQASRRYELLPEISLKSMPAEVSALSGEYNTSPKRI